VAKVKRLDTEDGTVWVFRCPGCDRRHRFRTEGDGPIWHWNEDPKSPSVVPSIHVMPGSKAECHFHIEDGKIKYLPDCHHELAGQPKELPEIQ